MPSFVTISALIPVTSHYTFCTVSPNCLPSSFIDLMSSCTFSNIAEKSILDLWRERGTLLVTSSVSFLFCALERSIFGAYMFYLPNPLFLTSSA